MTPRYEQQLAWEKKQKEAISFLNKTLPFLKENPFVLQEWVDNQELLPEYGYTTELKEEIVGLKEELTVIRRCLPESLLKRLEDMSLSDLMDLEERLK